MASHVSTSAGYPGHRCGNGWSTGRARRWPTRFRMLAVGSVRRRADLAREGTMVTHDTAWAGGTPCWVDLGVADTTKAGAFYSGLFGWEVQPGPPEAGGYIMCLKKGRPVAGIGPKQGPPGAPSARTPYIATGNADEAAGKVKAAGGQVLVEPMDVLDVGRTAIAMDPGGATFGIWQARTHTGVGLANEPGALCWNENLSRDLD